MEEKMTTRIRANGPILDVKSHDASWWRTTGLPATADKVAMVCAGYSQMLLTIENNAVAYPVPPNIEDRDEFMHQQMELTIRFEEIRALLNMILVAADRYGVPERILNKIYELTTYEISNHQ